MSRALLLALALVVAACTPPQQSVPSPTAPPTGSARIATPSASASAAALPDMSAVLLANPLPKADAFTLTRAMRGRDGQPAAPFVPIRTTPPVEDVGSQRSFWVYDFAAKKNNRISATLQIVTEHAKWWVQDDATVDLNALRQTAQVFETTTYPTTRRLFGSEWTPGVDADPRINALVARIPGAAAGYFSSTDQLPLWVNPFSAEREMIYISSAARLGSTSFNAVVAHEFCHMIQAGRGKRSATWFSEGFAQLCETAIGGTPSHARTFLLTPDTQLNDWTELEGSAAHYGGAHLFVEFLRQHAGGNALVNAFMDRGIDTPADIDAILRARGQKGMDELFADFVAANAFIGAQPVDRAHTYPGGLEVRSPASAADQDRLAGGGRLSTTVRSYAARYIELPRGKITVSFSGVTRTKLLPTDPRSGRAFWWSDRADGLDSRLTREVDLARATAPRLSFWTWYDIERDYDYAYVAVSTDGGARWTTLPAPATTTADPNGQNLGNAFTGPSGGGDRPQWIRQDVDLSAYAGQRVLLRFQYVTDGALSQHGFAIDDIEIPGVLSDDAETDTGWTAEGFVRSTNLVAQRYVVQLLRFTDRGATVERRAVDGGSLTLEVDTTDDRRAPLLAVSGLAVRTTQPAAFEVTVGRR